MNIVKNSELRMFYMYYVLYNFRPGTSLERIVEELHSQDMFVNEEELQKVLTNLVEDELWS